MTTGKDLASATLSFERITAKGIAEEFMTYKFADLRVRGYRHGGHGDVVTEDLAFSWGQVAVAYQGTGGPTGFTYANPDAQADDSAPACADLRDDAPAGTGVAAYMELQNVPGEATAKGHENEISLRGFCLPGGTSGSGATFGSFTVEKLYDRSTPVLLDQMTKAKAQGDATITFTRPGALGTESFLTYKFSGVRPDGYRQGGNGDPLDEDVSFDWRSVDADYRPGNSGDTWSFTR
jgi:type VI protein secretion system component Hcp